MVVSSLRHWAQFLISLPMIGLVALWRRGIAFAMLAWPFHIVLDFPFHTKAYFATPIFGHSQILLWME